ncbi:MAG: CsgG/HfaB family protein [Chitinispirillaceae bacterium]
MLFKFASVLLVGIVVFGFTSDVFAQNHKNRYAVMNIKTSGIVKESHADIIGDRLRFELFKTGRAIIMERSEMNEVLKEQGFQSSGACTDQACLVEMGQLLGVQYLISGSIGNLGKLLMLNFRVVDVEKGTITQIVGRDIEGSIEDIIHELPSVAAELMGIKPVQVTQRRIKKETPVVTVEEKKVEEKVSKSQVPGELDIEVYPSTAVVIINDEEYGKGDKEVRLPPGEYEVCCRSGSSRSDPETVKINPGESVDIECKAERPLRLNLGVDLSFMTGGPESFQMGPGFQIGLRAKNHLFALRYHIGANRSIDEAQFDNSYYTEDLESISGKLQGGGFQYRYIFALGNVVTLSPGALIGYWHERHKAVFLTSNYYLDEYSNDQIDVYYMGGPSFWIEIGYKRIFFNMEVAVLPSLNESSVKILISPGIAGYL